MLWHFKLYVHYNFKYTFAIEEPLGKLVICAIRKVMSIFVFVELLSSTPER